MLLCTSRGAFVERRIYSFHLCTRRRAFRTRDALVVCARSTVHFERRILLLFVHFAR